MGTLTSRQEPESPLGFIRGGQTVSESPMPNNYDQEAHFGPTPVTL